MLAEAGRKKINGNHRMAGGAREGAGRKAGVPNKITADVKALAQVHGEDAIRTLAALMVSADSDTAKIAAAKELLDRAYGKSRQGVDLEGNLNQTITKIVRQIRD